jgi:hypothetical protein
MVKLVDQLKERPNGPELKDAMVRMVKGEASTDDLNFTEEHFDTIAECAPQEELRMAITHAMNGLPTGEIENEVMEALDSLPDDARAAFGHMFRDGLRQEGINPSDAARQASAVETEPERMTTRDYARLIHFLVQTNPGALANTLSLQPSMITILGHNVIASVIMHLANEMWGGEPLERSMPERPGQVPKPPHYPHRTSEYDHTQEHEWEQTTTGGVKEPSAKPPKAGPMS